MTILKEFWHTIDACRSLCKQKGVVYNITHEIKVIKFVENYCKYVWMNFFVT